MKNIELNKQLPVITMNFEEVKNSLIGTMEKYKGIVVTEEGLKDCKATQKELAGLRVKIDNYRKDIKKEMSKPIDIFESQCKELIKLISDSESPIKDGIAIFDNAKREEKRQVALKIVEEVATEHQLSERYKSKLDVLDKYTNLTAKPSAVKKDIEQRVFILLQEQNRESEMLEIIKDTIENANKNIKTHLKLEDFQNLIDMNIPNSRILQEINKRAEIIREVESSKVEKQQTPVEVEKEPLKKETEEDPLYYIELRVIASKERIRELGEFLKNNNYNYTKSNTGIVE